MEKYYPKKDASTSGTHLETQKRVRIELDMDDIVADPGLRKSIYEFDPNIRDEAKRAYLSMGPCQPREHAFPRKLRGGQMRGFIKTWFDRFDWLEYSVEKKAAFCFYCYLFKPARIGNWENDTFTKDGYVNWRRGIETFNAHVGGPDSAHNKARKCAADFKNQRQSVAYVWSEKSTEREEKYKARLIIVLGIVRFLLLQALAFRGHDESSSSTNRGNFLEMLEWYKNKDPKAASVLGVNAPKNCQMIAPEIQKDLVKACAHETRNVIISELKGRLFAVLVDESRDKSIKEQKAVILRYVPTFILMF
jgi:hypothetical protein